MHILAHRAPPAISLSLCSGPDCARTPRPQYHRHATSLRLRLEQTWAALLAVQHLLPPVPEAGSAASAYELAHASLQQFVANMHTEWYNTIDANVARHLQSTLLVQDRAAGGCVRAKGRVRAGTLSLGARPA